MQGDERCPNCHDTMERVGSELHCACGEIIPLDPKRHDRRLPIRFGTGENSYMGELRRRQSDSPVKAAS